MTIWEELRTVNNGLTTNTVYDDLGRKYTETESDGNNYSVFRDISMRAYPEYVRRACPGSIICYSILTRLTNTTVKCTCSQGQSRNETVSYTYDINNN